MAQIKTFLTSLFGGSEHAQSQNFRTINWWYICSGIHPESPIKAAMGAVFPNPKKQRNALCWIWLWRKAPTCPYSCCVFYPCRTSDQQQHWNDWGIGPAIAISCKKIIKSLSLIGITKVAHLKQLSVNDCVASFLWTISKAHQGRLVAMQSCPLHKMHFGQYIPDLTLHYYWMNHTF